MSLPPGSEKPAPAGSRDGQISEARGNDATAGAGDKDPFVERVHRVEIAAAVLFLAMLPRTARPITPAVKLKHIAEDLEPTLHGYISEERLIEAAQRLGIAVRDGHVGVRLPRRQRNPQPEGPRR